MTQGTAIQWTEATWNPVTGCTRVSAGCAHCFDGWEKITDRAGSPEGGTWSHKRRHDDAANGPKTLWLWRYT